MRSKVQLMKEVAALVRRHMDGIVAWTQTRRTNGFLEAINGLFQAAKRRARLRAPVHYQDGHLPDRGEARLPSDQPACSATHLIFNRAKYLNNMIEQDQRGVKSRINPMLGFRSSLALP